MSANAGESARVVLAAALDYIARGWSPIPIPHREKGPLLDAWQDIRVNAETAAAYFNGAKQNVGIVLGKASGGLTDLDLDCPESIAAAPYILPRTAVFGRATKPASHWVYRTNLHETKDRAAIKFMGSDKTGLLEVRMGAGGLASQTVFPPSTHVSGEPIEWAGSGASEIAEVDGDELIRRARRLAVASELARSYPKIGGRHDAAFVLGSFLARCGFSQPGAATFVEAVAAASLQPGDKRRDMARTARDGAAAGKLAGFPLLAVTFGEGAAKKVADWLDYAGEREGGSARAAKGVQLGVVDGDLLAGLVEKSAADPGPPFGPEILTSLADLRQTDRAAFEALRAALKRTGCRVTALEEAIVEETGVASGGRAQTQADILLRLSQDADLFHVSDGTGYADLVINGHRETWPVRSKGFTRWLARAFFDETHGAPNSEALQSALNVVEARAMFDAAERIVHVRVASLDGKLYLDLCDLAWRAVEISAAGWRVVNSPPVRFRRASGALELPEPECGGSIADLEPFLNVRSVRDFVLIVAGTLAALLDHGPYPALSFAGEQGTAKSTVSKILRALIDPNTAPLRALPRNDRELFISATNAHLLVFDNVSGLPPWLSDTLCRLSSGGGFSVRSLWTNNDEVLFDAARPAILNGIGDIITRPDLADRALFITLKLISDTERPSDSEILAAFEVKRPRILGALMDALAVGLRRLSTTCLSEKPQMADFALWATACEQAFWKEGTFWAAYSDNLEEVVNTVIEADLVGAAVRQLAMERESWEGTSLGLLSALRGIVDDEGTTRSKDWPNSPEGLSNPLRRAATFLRKAGVEVSFRREGKQRTRMITIAAARKKADGEPSAPSALSARSAETNDYNDLQADGLGAVTHPADSSTVRRHPNRPPTVRLNPLKNEAADAADGSDGQRPPISGGQTRI
jgi:hypothetical protein